jgi:predicted small metal-binding protein
MPKTLNCRDVGVDCDASFTGETEEEIMAQAAEHARTEHGLDEVPPELAEKARGAIREAQAAG